MRTDLYDLHLPHIPSALLLSACTQEHRCHNAMMVRHNVTRNRILPWTSPVRKMLLQAFRHLQKPASYGYLWDKAFLGYRALEIYWSSAIGVELCDVRSHGPGVRRFLRIYTRESIELRRKNEAPKPAG